MDYKTQTTITSNFKRRTTRGRFNSLLLKACAPALLVALSVVSSCKNGGGNNNNTASDTQSKELKDSLTMARDTIRMQSDAAHVQMDEYATIRAKLDSQLMKKDAEIKKLKSINGNLSSTNKKLAAELKTNKKLIASLKEDLNEKTKTFEQQLGLLENDKKDLMRQRDSILAKYNKVLALGSVLHASNIRLTAVHFKKHGTKEKTTSKARKADELKVVFDIDENRIAENGTKQLYLVVKDPAGNLLTSTAAGSGSMTLSNGSQMKYTILKEIPLTTNVPVNDVTAEWKQEGDYEKGTYTITIYNGGYRIGGGQVELR